MKGLKYQLKNIRRDKMCILSFLLPIVVAVAINLLTGVGFSSVSETSFGTVKGDLSEETTSWLQTNGTITVFENISELEIAITNPSTQMIGVLSDGNGIKTLLSGDEYQVNTVIGDTLPKLYNERNMVESSTITIIPTHSDSDGFTALFIAITMVTAMFMGCTFNAMSMIGEKEDGISFINEVLPMTQLEFITQKMVLGFAGGALSTAITALICMKMEVSYILPLLLMIVLSSFVAALTGLFIGWLSNGLMVGIVYIKVVMILFLAPPILFYLAIPKGSVLYFISYLVPSSATFYGLMDLLTGQLQGIWVNIVVLLIHCIGWLLIFIIITKRKAKKKLPPRLR